MLFVFYGNDVVGVRKAAHDFLSEHKNGETAVETITPENYEPGRIRDAAGGASLFGGEQVIVLDTLSAKKEVFEDILLHLELLSESANTFVLIEESLLASEKKKFVKYGKECVEVTAPKIERFNVFALADAFSRRDKKSLWVLLMRAFGQGLSGEEIIGTLYWQIKVLRLAERASNAQEAGQKPFVFNKAKTALAKFKEGELGQLSRDLLSIYHDGHLGKRDLNVALERWVLTL